MVPTFDSMYMDYVLIKRQKRFQPQLRDQKRYKPYSLSKKTINPIHD